MHRRFAVPIWLFATPIMLVGAPANATEFVAKMVGFQEVPSAILSAGTGTLVLDLTRAHPPSLLSACSFIEGMQ